MGAWKNSWITMSTFNSPKMQSFICRWLLHIQTFHFFFPHCSLVTLKITSLLRLSHLGFSPKLLEFTKKKKSPRKLTTWRRSLYNLSPDRILFCRQQPDTVFRVGATLIHPHILFFQLIVTRCARHHSECFMWLKTE